MGCITKGVLRFGLIGAVGLGGLTLLVGPQRVAAGLHQARASVQDCIDSAIDDPTALRRQIHELAEEYPDRIAEVRGELTAVERQLEQFHRDSQIADKVVAMATGDLRTLQDKVTRAESAKLASNGRAIEIRFDGRRFNVDTAYAEATRINNVRVRYQDRLASNIAQLDVLKQQQTRLVEILEKLEGEYQTFQTQLWQLDRQIDAIERNDRLIEMTEDMQSTLRSYDKWGKVGSLNQLEAKLSELRDRQKAQLDVLTNMNVGKNYEREATFEMNTGDADCPFESPFDCLDSDAPADDAPVAADMTADSDAMAWLGAPIVVE